MGYSVKRIDRNQKEIVETLRKSGNSVQITSSLGNGFVDIVVGCEGLTILGNSDKILKALRKVTGLTIFEGANLLVEIKDGEKPPSARKLTPDELNWHESWKGQVIIVSSPEEALKIIGRGHLTKDKDCEIIRKSGKKKDN